MAFASESEMKMVRQGLRWAGRAGGGVVAAGGCLGVPGMALAAAPTMGSASFTTPGEYSPTVPAGGSAITAPTDARAIQLLRSGRGEELLSLSAEIFGQLRAGWSHQLGEERLRGLEDDLEVIAGTGHLADMPGWIR
jgi:hypothetical protein